MCIEDEIFYPAQFLLKCKGRWTSVRGYHEYKAIWAAAVAEELECRREPTNLIRHLNVWTSLF